MGARREPNGNGNKIGASHSLVPLSAKVVIIKSNTETEHKRSANGVITGLVQFWHRAWEGVGLKRSFGCGQPVLNRCLVL